MTDTNRSLWARWATVAVAAIAGSLRVVPISDPDYHWHLHTGRFVAQHREVPARDPFSHTFAGAPWAFVDWVSDVGMYALHRLGGDTLVVAFFAAMGALAIHLATVRSETVDDDLGARLTVALLVAAAVFFRITPRPQTLTFALLAAVLLLLDRARRREGSIAWVPVAIALWQNLHGSALIAVATVAAYAVGAFLERRDDARRWALVFIASCAALFVCVRPVARLAAGFAHLGDPRVGRLFPEWGHAFAQGAFGPHVIALTVLLGLALLGLRRTRESLGLGAWLAGVGLGVVGLLSVRFVPLAAIALGAPALAGLAGLRNRLLSSSALRGGLAIVAAVPLALMVRRPGVGLARGYFPEHAAAVLESHGLQGKLFNDVEQGGYLLWRLGGEAWPVFVDGRSMAVYGIAFVETTATATGPAFDDLLRRFDVSVVVTAPNRRAGMLARNADWLLVFFDDTAAVFVRARDASPEARRLAYREIQPTTWFELGPYVADPARLSAARVEAERAVAEAPDSSLAAVLRIGLAIAAGDRARADAWLADASARFPDEQRVLRAGLLRCLHEGDRECVCVRARDIERRFPHNSYTRETLARFSCR